MTDIDYAMIYRSVRLRVTDLVRNLPDDLLVREAPATPAWRVRDIVAHLAGSTADIVAGNLGDVASDAWTQAQVDARIDVPVVEVLEEWERCSASVEPTIQDFPPIMRMMLLTDAVTHEHDILGAIGTEGDRGSEAVAFAFHGVSRAIGAQRGEGRALHIVHDGGDAIVGDGEPSATVRTSRFEILRAGVGRRSYEQLAVWDWDGEPLVESLVLGRFSPPRLDPLVE
jgi:uncharacterized protein (TIGR03083 family)